MRRYLEEKDTDYIIIINSKIFKNSEGKNRKRRCRNSGFSDSGADIMRIRFNLSSFYNASSE